MIDHLRISGLGVIGEATVDLDPGFTVVTGETGAGKTMVVTALGLLLGAANLVPVLFSAAGRQRAVQFHSPPKGWSH